MKKENKTNRYIDTLELESIYISDKSASTISDERAKVNSSAKASTIKENEKKKDTIDDIKDVIKQLLSC